MKKIYFPMPEPTGKNIMAADSIAAADDAVTSLKKQNSSYFLSILHCDPANREENASAVTHLGG